METDLAIHRVLRRRSEIAGSIEHLESRVAGMRSDLRHLDAALRILGYAGKETDLPVRKSCTSGLFHSKELPRLVMTHLRGGNDGLKASEIAVLISSDKGWEVSDDRFQLSLAAKVSGALGKLKAKGLCAVESGAAGHVWRAIKP
jgi:hypothetical protein